MKYENSLKFGYATDRGSFRTKNQDRILCARTSIRGHLVGVSCICDGIGSFSESEIASQMIVKGIKKWFDEAVPYYPEVMNKVQLIEDLEFTIRELNELVFEHNRKNRNPIGCTMSLIFILDREYWIFHVGDSRIYCLRHMLKKMTQDEIILKQINGKEKTFLINYIGKKENISIQKNTGFIQNGDVFILGTDGLYKKLTCIDIQELSKYMINDEEIKKICKYLISKIRGRGEMDNISCVVLKVAEGE